MHGSHHTMAHQAPDQICLICIFAQLLSQSKHGQKWEIWHLHHSYDIVYIPNHDVKTGQMQVTNNNIYNVSTDKLLLLKSLVLLKALRALTSVLVFLANLFLVGQSFIQFHHDKS
jgi:hypothetical protein